MTGPWPDKRFRELTPELLASLSADDVGDAVVQHVHLRIADAGGDWEREPEVVAASQLGLF